MQKSFHLSNPSLCNNETRLRLSVNNHQKETPILRNQIHPSCKENSHWIMRQKKKKNKWSSTGRKTNSQNKYALFFRSIGFFFPDPVFPDRIRGLITWKGINSYFGESGFDLLIPDCYRMRGENSGRTGAW
ncbi:hypothetical protein CEXT_137841 [Caerostris extrusa]|uniref:Uncharacterized protein n=1 Tax=Caerostris extrusa TaxID=172846 RepID=A0AAV4MK03_CAEEX|nr:hypothetical protein CEXT_137841 [Caerostris extrusa]